MVLAKRMKQLMTDQGLNITSLSKQSKVPVQTIHNWLNGQQPKNIEQLRRVAQVLRVSIDSLCFGAQVRHDPDALKNFDDEINAGTFEVVLRRFKK